MNPKDYLHPAVNSWDYVHEGFFFFSFFHSNDTFENACMEFDEVNLKPTFKILWGVPGFQYQFRTSFIHAATFSFSLTIFI